MHLRVNHPIAKWGLVTLALVLALGSLAGCGLLSSEESSGTSSDGDSEVAISPGVAPLPTDEVDAARSKDSYDQSVASPEYLGAGEDASNVASEDRLVIRNTGVRVRVEDVAAAVVSIRGLATEFGASITMLQVSTDDQTPVYDYATAGSLADGEPLSGFITVKVPAEKLTQFTEKVSALGTVLQQSADESDVTQEHIDLKARLKNLESQEARLRDFFDAAKKVEEMLMIEQELGRVRGEIEAMQAQIAYLERQAAMATVTIQLVRPEPLISSEEERTGFREAVKDGLGAAADLIQYGVTILIAMSPLWIPAVVILGIVVFVRRSRRRKFASMQNSMPQNPPQENAYDPNSQPGSGV